ncbi:MAG: DUF1015 domain-containing protein [Candidatus Poribacteria bacterium]|nr:DUF1015 domain-containing protein [Candidatus Poribacteria bacterium]
MATIVSFRGLRYNPQKISDIGKVIAPPYDVIKDEQRIGLEEKHLHNIIRLILSQPSDRDTEKDNQYTRAAALMRRWIAESIFIRDASPCYYVYDQTFTTPDGAKHTRRALIGNGKLEAFGAGAVFPHERTLAAPKADRLNLIRECHANLSPIFLLYSDAEDDIENAMTNFTGANSPLVDVPEMFGSTHRLWRIDDTRVNEAIQSHFDSKSLVIADGHHRYETALAFRDEIRAQSGSWTGEESYNYVMMNLVRMESSGLVVLAIHRLISGLYANQIAEAIDRLPEYFSMKAYDNLNDLLENLHAFAGKRPAFGMYIGDDRYRLLLPEMDRERAWDVTKSDVYNNLDVTILHTRFLKELLGIDTAIPAHQKQVSYTVNTDEAIEYVKADEGRIALFINPTPVSQVDAIAIGGETMPQKSTYFYPKMATGLVLNLLKSD